MIKYKIFVEMMLLWIMLWKIKDLPQPIHIDWKTLVLFILIIDNISQLSFPHYSQKLLLLFLYKNF